MSARPRVLGHVSDLDLCCRFSCGGAGVRPRRAGDHWAESPSSAGGGAEGTPTAEAQLVELPAASVRPDRLGSVAGNGEAVATRGDPPAPSPREHSAPSASCSAKQSIDQVKAIEETFYLMERRMRQRAFHGKKGTKGFARTLLDVGVLLVPFVVFSDLVRFSPQLQWGFVAPTVVTVWIVCVNMWMTVQSPEHIFMEWAKTVLYVCVMWFAWVYDPSYHEECRLWSTTRGFQGECFTYEENAVIRVLVAVEALIFVIWVVVRFGYPSVLVCAGAQTFWRLRAHPGGLPGVFSYRPFGWFSPIRRECAYQGDVDSLGRPHGQGSWTDDSYHGECMTGLWEHGVPVGPFASREHGTGAQFVNLRLGFCTARAEQSIGSTALRPRSLPEPRIGGAGVECSTAGGFFSDLPRVDVVRDFGGLGRVGQALTWVQEGRARATLSSISLNVVDDSAADGEALGRQLSRGAAREGHAPGDGAAAEAGRLLEPCCRRASVPVYVMRGRGYALASQLPAPVAVLRQPRREALIFVHGFNASLEDSLTRMGQLCALGSLPSHIVPFVYSWAAGQIVSYFQVKAAVPESARDLAPFVEALAAQGIEKMHLMIHSMGAQVLLAAWPQLTRVFRRLRAFDRDRCELRERSSPTASQPSTGARSPVLGTLTLVNADVSRAQALEVLHEMVEVAEHVTFYNDAHDVALWGSSLVSGEPSLGRFPEPISCSHNLQEYGAECIDVIDCTSMEQNVHAVRHCYYCFNVQILEDIVDLIQSGAPARLRTARLVSKGIGNVFSFLCPPAFLRE